METLAHLVPQAGSSQPWVFTLGAGPHLAYALMLLLTRTLGILTYSAFTSSWLILPLLFLHNDEKYIRVVCSRQCSRCCVMASSQLHPSKSVSPPASS